MSYALCPVATSCDPPHSAPRAEGGAGTVRVGCRLLPGHAGVRPSPFRRHVPRAARVQCAPGSACYPVAPEYDPPMTFDLCDGCLEREGHNSLRPCSIQWTRWWMKERIRQPQNLSPCPRSSARSVLTGRRPGCVEACPLPHSAPCVEAARVQCAPGVVWSPVAQERDPPRSDAPRRGRYRYVTGHLPWRGGGQDRGEGKRKCAIMTP